MAKVSTLSLICLIAALLPSGLAAQIACADTTTFFFPVEPGNTWTYHYDFDTAAAIERSIGDTVIREGVVYRIYRYSPQFEVYIRSDSLGRVWKYIPLYGAEVLWFDFTKGDGTVYFCPGDWGEYFWVSVNKCIPCTSEVGTFDNCLQFYFNDPYYAHEDIIYTFAPGLGIVREQHNGWYTYIIDAMVLGEESGSSPDHVNHRLRRNYPNPFNPTTTIAFSLPAPGTIRLEVFDIVGRLVATLVDGRVAGGGHNVEWDGAGHPGGVYYYRLTGEDVRETGKMVLMK